MASDLAKLLLFRNNNSLSLDYSLVYRTYILFRQVRYQFSGLGCVVLCSEMASTLMDFDKVCGFLYVVQCVCSILLCVYLYTCI